jgi:hypothetical protein
LSSLLMILSSKCTVAMGMTMLYSAVDGVASPKLG